MKVGTDGTLLGAWASHPSPHTILDIGTGSGLVALMLAQRYEEAQIVGIDIDLPAAEQAAENFAASPWGGRLQAQHASLQEWRHAGGPYDMIVSNPPYFVDSLKNPDQGRRTARHTDTLPFETLIEAASAMLAADGVLALILPTEAEERIVACAQKAHLSISRITRIYTREGKASKRFLIEMRADAVAGNVAEERTSASAGKEDSLCLMGNDGAPRSAAYQALTNDFYL